MSGMTVYFTDGTYLNFPQGFTDAQSVVDWFRDARDGQVITLNADNGVFYVQKRHITRISVDKRSA